MTEKLRFGWRTTKQREEGSDKTKIHEDKKDKVQLQGYAVRKRGTPEEELDTTGMRDQEKTEDDDGNPKKTITKDGDVTKGYKNGFPLDLEEEQQRVKELDVNADGGDGGERKTGVDDARTEVEEEALMEELLTAVGLGRWQVPLILTALISKYADFYLFCILGANLRV